MLACLLACLLGFSCSMLYRPCSVSRLKIIFRLASLSLVDRKQRASVLQMNECTRVHCRPEIQATVKAPSIKNFRIAVTLYYMFAMSLWIVITVIGYW